MVFNLIALKLKMFFKLLFFLKCMMRYDFIGVMVKSGEVFPANFPDKGPEQPLRLARLFTGLQPVCTLNAKYIYLNILFYMVCLILGVRRV